MNDEQKQLFRMILTEALQDITEKEFADLIDTFIALYEAKFGVREKEDSDEEQDEPEIIHTREATEYLKRFKI